MQNTILVLHSKEYKSATSKNYENISLSRDYNILLDITKKKGPKDFVTKTDKRVEKILIEELEKSKKNYSFITEETGIINKSSKIF